jgi:hypothetical protein
MWTSSTFGRDYVLAMKLVETKFNSNPEFNQRVTSIKGDCKQFVESGGNKGDVSAKFEDGSIFELVAGFCEWKWPEGEGRWSTLRAGDHKIPAQGVGCT